MLNALNRSDRKILNSTAYVVVVGPIDPLIVWRNPLLAEHPVSMALNDDLVSIFRKMPSASRVG